MLFLVIKSLHIIFIITWFAALFYMPRLFVYMAEAENKDPFEKEILQKQYLLMQKRLWYGIAWPSTILTMLFGPWLLILYGTVPDWMWWKLGFVVGVLIYHIVCHSIFKQHQKGVIPYSAFQMRVWNEVATILLVAIIFLVVLKNTLHMFYGLIGLMLFMVVLISGIFIYKKIRQAE